MALVIISDIGFTPLQLPVNLSKFHGKGNFRTAVLGAFTGNELLNHALQSILRQRIPRNFKVGQVSNRFVS